MAARGILSYGAYLPYRRLDRSDIRAVAGAGGGSGAANRFTVVRGGGTVEPAPMPGQGAGVALPGRAIGRVESCGGGGFRDPPAPDPGRAGARPGRRRA